MKTIVNILTMKSFFIALTLFLSASLFLYAQGTKMVYGLRLVPELKETLGSGLHHAVAYSSSGQSLVVLSDDGETDGFKLGYCKRNPNITWSCEDV